jgi:membrane protease YdiL (CAAX protease family)
VARIAARQKERDEAQAALQRLRERPEAPADELAVAQARLQAAEAWLTTITGERELLENLATIAEEQGRMWEARRTAFVAEDGDERRAATELSPPGAGREWAIGALVGAGLYIACVLILMLLGIYRIEGMNPISFLIPAIAMAVKSAIFEELVFRGVLLKSVEDMLGTWVAVILSSATFGFLHLLNPDATIGGAIYITIEAGLLLAGAYLVTRRLWMCIGFHMAWNYVQSAVFSGIVSGGVTEPGLIRDTITGPDLLTGGSFGMERSVVALVLCTTMGVILLLMASRRGHILPPPWKR